MIVFRLALGCMQHPKFGLNTQLINVNSTNENKHARTSINVLLKAPFWGL